MDLLEKAKILFYFKKKKMPGQKEKKKTMSKRIAKSSVYM